MRVVDRFDDETDALFAEIEPSLGVATVRDQTYLNWRYSDHPDSAGHFPFGLLQPLRVDVVVFCPDTVLTSPWCPLIGAVDGSSGTRDHGCAGLGVWTRP